MLDKNFDFYSLRISLLFLYKNRYLCTNDMVYPCTPACLQNLRGILSPAMLVLLLLYLLSWPFVKPRRGIQLVW